MDYTDFCTDQDAATFRAVKRMQMNLADAGRAAVAEMTGAAMSTVHDERQYLVTSRGTFRLAMLPNSDNRTEQRAHDEAGAVTLLMSDDEAMRVFFLSHGIHRGVSKWKGRVRRALAGQL